jgi:hypothetical protein
MGFAQLKRSTPLITQTAGEILRVRVALLSMLSRSDGVSGWPYLVLSGHLVLWLSRVGVQSRLRLLCRFEAGFCRWHHPGTEAVAGSLFHFALPFSRRAIAARNAAISAGGFASSNSVFVHPVFSHRGT